MVSIARALVSKPKLLMLNESFLGLSPNVTTMNTFFLAWGGAICDDGPRCKMGMFDTIRLDEPLVCPACGNRQSTLQTHHFGETLDTYRIGMLVPECPVLTGILLESFWCSACHNADLRSSPQLHVVIWNSILVAVEWARDDAERKLAAVDRLSLIQWLDRTQREAAEWRREYHALRNDLARWHDYQEQEKQRASASENVPQHVASRLLNLFDPDEAIRAAADPLAAILERHPPDENSCLLWD